MRVEVKTDSMQDRAALEVEICRLRRIEAKVDSSTREAIVRRIQELQIRLHGPSSHAKSSELRKLRKTA
jgi:hypothetical protein